MPVAQRLGARLDDMVGGAEIGLPDAQVDDVLALLAQRLGARQDLERRLRAQTAHAFSQSDHRLPLPVAGAVLAGY
jgi:hypothetical protein